MYQCLVIYLHAALAQIIVPVDGLCLQVIVQAVAAVIIALWWLRLQSADGHH